MFRSGKQKRGNSRNEGIHGILCRSESRQGARQPAPAQVGEQKRLDFRDDTAGRILFFGGSQPFKGQP